MPVTFSGGCGGSALMASMKLLLTVSALIREVSATVLPCWSHIFIVIVGEKCLNKCATACSQHVHAVSHTHMPELTSDRDTNVCSKKLMATTICLVGPYKPT